MEFFSVLLVYGSHTGCNLKTLFACLNVSIRALINSNQTANVRDENKWFYTITKWDKNKLVWQDIACIFIRVVQLISVLGFCSNKCCDFFILLINFFILPHDPLSCTLNYCTKFDHENEPLIFQCFLNIILEISKCGNF